MLTHRRKELAEVKLTRHLVIFPAAAGGAVMLWWFCLTGEIFQRYACF